MIDAFDGLQSCGRIIDYLQASLSQEKTTHAYLIVGSDATSKEDLALRFAAALVADGDLEQFQTARRLVHPDVHILEPAGAAGYVVDQVRDLVRDAELAPVRSSRKVYVLSRAESLQSAPANAFLKTLEEPPGDVVCILLANRAEAVMETLRSRCEVLSLNEVSSHEQLDCELSGVLMDLANGCDNRSLLAAAARMVARSQEASAELERSQVSEFERNKDFLSAAALRDLEKQHKRVLTMSQRKALFQQLDALRAWLRSCLLVNQGAVELADNATDALVMQIATGCPSAAILKALRAVDACEESVSYNVTLQLAVEAMCMEIREALCQQ